MTRKSSFEKSLLSWSFSAFSRFVSHRKSWATKSKISVCRLTIRFTVHSVKQQPRHQREKWKYLPVFLLVLVPWLVYFAILMIATKSPWLDLNTVLNSSLLRVFALMQQYIEDFGRNTGTLTQFQQLSHKLFRPLSGSHDDDFACCEPNSVEIWIFCCKSWVHRSHRLMNRGVNPLLRAECWMQDACCRLAMRIMHWIRLSHVPNASQMFPASYRTAQKEHRLTPRSHPKILSVHHFENCSKFTRHWNLVFLSVAVPFWTWKGSGQCALHVRLLDLLQLWESIVTDHELDLQTRRLVGKSVLSDSRWFQFATGREFWGLFAYDSVRTDLLTFWNSAGRKWMTVLWWTSPSTVKRPCIILEAPFPPFLSARPACNYVANVMWFRRDLVFVKCQLVEERSMAKAIHKATCHPLP